MQPMLRQGMGSTWAPPVRPKLVKASAWSLRVCKPCCLSADTNVHDWLMPCSLGKVVRSSSSCFETRKLLDTSSTQHPSLYALQSGCRCFIGLSFWSRYVPFNTCTDLSCCSPRQKFFKPRMASSHACRACLRALTVGLCPHQSFRITFDANPLLEWQRCPS